MTPPLYSLSFMDSALGAQYETYLLDVQDIDTFLGLQETALAECAMRGKAHFIKPRSAENLRTHLDAGMPIIGVRHIHTGAHVAQALLTDPHAPGVANLDGYPATEGARIVQSFFIHPDHRYLSLSESVRNTGYPAQLIFTRAKKIAAEDGATRLIAKIADDNINSLKSFARGGFGETLATGIDLHKGYTVRYMGVTLEPVQPVQALNENVRMEAVPYAIAAGIAPPAI